MPGIPREGGKRAAGDLEGERDLANLAVEPRLHRLTRHRTDARFADMHLGERGTRRAAHDEAAAGDTHVEP